MQSILFTIALIAPACLCATTEWKPIPQSRIFGTFQGQLPTAEASFPDLPGIVAQSYQQPSELHSSGGECSIYKVAFTQDLYFQYIQYKLNLPELKEFTICHWTKFTNHTNDHPIYSYAVDGHPRAIYAWVANTDRSSYFSLAIAGQTLYRLNYPLRINRWYHTCQSWNGRTGEWQIWVNGERVGRGFHNRLVGHKIPPGGIAITGQEQTQPGGGFLEGSEAPKGAGGMLGEITMVQLYKIALTAGKAHRDHKHHHAHTFDHNGMPITTTPRPPTTPRPTSPTHPLITGGQLNPNIALSIASGQPQPPQQLLAQPLQGFDPQLLLNDPYSNSLFPQVTNGAQSRGPQIFTPQQSVSGQPATLSLPQDDFAYLLPVQQNNQQAPISQTNSQPLINSGLVHTSLTNPANVQFIDETLDTHKIFKRDNKNSTSNADKKKRKRKQKSKLSESLKEIDPVAQEATNSSGKATSKRELFLQDGTLLNTDPGNNLFDGSYLVGLAGINPNDPALQQKQPPQEEEEREPAEFEVRTVMNICSGCEPEPFDKALIFGWRGVTKKLYSGAFYTPAIPQCKAF